MADSTRTFEKTDNTELGYEAVWIPVFAIPAAIAWWQDWTVAMWILAALTFLAVVGFASEFFARNDTKWQTGVIFERWPLPLGGPTTITVALDAIQIGPGIDGEGSANGPVVVDVTLTCEERFVKKAPTNNTDDAHRRGEFETELVVDRTESSTAQLVGGEATVEIPLNVPIDRGAPTQRIEAPPMTFEVLWNVTIRLPEYDRVLFDGEVPVAAIWQPSGSSGS